MNNRISACHAPRKRASSNHSPTQLEEAVPQYKIRGSLESPAFAGDSTQTEASISRQALRRNRLGELVHHARTVGSPQPVREFEGWSVGLLLSGRIERPLDFENVIL